MNTTQLPRLNRDQLGSPSARYGLKSGPRAGWLAVLFGAITVSVAGCASSDDGATTTGADGSVSTGTAGAGGTGGASGAGGNRDGGASDAQADVSIGTGGAGAGGTGGAGGAGAGGTGGAGGVLDASPDAIADSAYDAGSDAKADSGYDAGSDAKADSGYDASTDAGIDTGIDTGTVNPQPDAGSDASTPSVDSGSDAAAVVDAGVVDAPAPAIDGAIASCVHALNGLYVVRADGKLLYENTVEQVIADADTGLSLDGVTDVAAGSHIASTYHGCAVVPGGKVKCWQLNATYGNSSGQLGNGTTAASAVLHRGTTVLTGPNAPLTNAVTVMADEDTSCAVTSDGKLWCWGDLTWLVNKGTPALHVGYAQAITVDGSTALTGVLQASIRSNQGCALVQGSPNSVWCWGYNGSQSLGQGDTVARQYPVKVLGLTAPTKVSVIAAYKMTTRSVRSMTATSVAGEITETAR